MQGDRARAFMQAIFCTEETEIDCARFLDVVARYVDSEVEGRDPLLVEPQFAHHAGLCPECAELDQTLLRVADLEFSGRLPQTDALWDELATLAGWTPSGSRLLPKVAFEPSRRSFARLREAVRARPRTLVLTAFGTCAAVAIAAGVWTVGRSRMKSEFEPFVAVASSATELRTAQLPGGGTLRILYSPDSQSFVVGTESGESGRVGRVRCWLIAENGERQLARYRARIRGTYMWVAEADQPLAAYVALAVTSEASGKPMAQIALR